MFKTLLTTVTSHGRTHCFKDILPAMSSLSISSRGMKNLPPEAEVGQPEVRGQRDEARRHIEVLESSHPREFLSTDNPRILITGSLGQLGIGLARNFR